MRRGPETRDGRGGVMGRGLRRFYWLSALLYVALGAVFTTAALASSDSPFSNNPFFPLPGRTTSVPTGSDDASVLAYYDYLNARHYDQIGNTYLYDVNTLLTMYGIILLAIVILYFFAYAWYARRQKNDLYPVEVYNGYITERGSGVDPFNWALYVILLAYMVYYTVVQVVYGQLY